MTKQQNNKRTMLESVLSLLETNNTSTSSYPGISESIGKFKDLLKDIQNKTVVVSEATAGKTAAKRLSRAELTVAMLQVSGALHALACKSGDEELKAKTDMLESDFIRMRGTEFQSAAASILELAKDNAEGLAGQGFGAEVVSGFEAKVDEFQKAFGDSVSAIPNRKAARERMKELIAEVDRVLGDEIDKYLEFFRIAAPEFYTAYFEARRIRKLGVRHEAAEPEMIVPAAAPVAKAA